MKIKDLIALLSKYDENEEIRAIGSTYDSWGEVDNTTHTDAVITKDKGCDYLLIHGVYETIDSSESMEDWQKYGYHSKEEYEEEMEYRNHLIEVEHQEDEDILNVCVMFGLNYNDLNDYSDVKHFIEDNINAKYKYYWEDVVNDIKSGKLIFIK